MLLGIFGFPFSDADCDAFLSPVNPLSPACLRCPQSPHWTGQSLVSGSGSAPAAPKHCQSRIRRRPAQALGPHLPHPRRLTQDIYKVSMYDICLYICLSNDLYQAGLDLEIQHILCSSMFSEV